MAARRSNGDGKTLTVKGREAPGRPRPILKAAGSRPLDQLGGIADSEAGAASISSSSSQAIGAGDRRAVAGTGGKRQDRGRTALVAQIVEEDPPLRLALRDWR
jgi:hypothetical protein